MSEVGRLGRNFTAVAIAQFISQFLTFVLSLSLARCLGVGLYGIFVFAFAVPIWFILLTSLGMDSVLTIDVAADKSKASSYLTTISALRLPLSLATVAILWLSIYFLMSDPFARTITMILGISSILQTYAGTFTAMFRAFERMGLRALITISERLVTTSLVLLALYLGFGLLVVSVIFVAGSLFSFVLSIVVLRSKLTWFSRRIEITAVMTILKRTVPFALAAVVVPLMYSTAPVLLSLLRDYAATGTFSAAFALTMAVLVPFSIYDIVFLPAMSRMHKKTPHMLPIVLRRTQKLFFMVGLPVALGGWFYAEGIVAFFYGGAFQDSARSFEVLILLVAISASMLGVRTILVATGHQRLILYNTTAGALISFSLCFALIPPWGPVGAAVAFLVGNIVIAILAYIEVNRMVTGTYLRQTVPKPVLAGTVMILLLHMLPNLSLWLGITIGSLSYVLVLLALGGLVREDWTLVKEAVRGALLRS